MKVLVHLERRVLIVRNSYGAHSIGFCLYFSNQIKFVKNCDFFAYKTALSALLPRSRFLKVFECQCAAKFDLKLFVAHMQKFSFHKKNHTADLI